MKQVIVMRTDLNMRKGKMVAQGAHATLGVIIGRDISSEEVAAFAESGTWKMLSITQEVHDWVKMGMKKICVGVSTESALLDIITAAKTAGLLCYKVTDAGHTEFGGIPTVTCCAIGPAPDAEIDKITGNLKLL